MGGVYNPLNLGLYTYAHQNPVKLVDPDGNASYNPWNIREAFNPHNLNDAGPRGPDAGYGPGMRANGMPDRGRSYDNRSWKQIQADDLRLYKNIQMERALKSVPKTGQKVDSSVSRKGQSKTDFLFRNRDDAMNWARQKLGHGAKRTFNEDGQWNGWANKNGDKVYWNHGDWGKGVGKSTYPHLNYKIGKEQGHLFLGNKIQNKGMWDNFVKDVLKTD